MNTNSSNIILQRAIELATKCHGNTIDRSKELVILHSLNVMFKCAPVHEIMTIAILHDVIEDCDVELTHLQSLRFPEIIISGVISITRHVIDKTTGKLVCRQILKEDTKEKYTDFINRVANHPLGVIVKMQDLEHNLSPMRTNKLNHDEIIPTIKKYRQAQATLFRPYVRSCFKYYGGMI